MTYTVESCEPQKAGGFRVLVRSTAYRYPRIALVLPEPLEKGLVVCLERDDQGRLFFEPQELHFPGMSAT